MITSNHLVLVSSRMKKPDKEHHKVIDELTNALQSYNIKSDKEKEKVKDPELRKIIELQQEKITQMEEEITYFKMNNKEMEDQVIVLQDEYNEIQARMDLANEEIDSMKEESQNLEKEITNHMDKDKKNQELVKSLQNQISPLENALETKEMEISKLQREATQSKDDGQEINVGDMKFNYEIKISGLQNKISELKNQLSRVNQNTSQITDLEGQVQQKELKIKEEKALFDKREKENKELTVQNDKLKRENTLLVERYEDQISTLKSQIEKMEQSIAMEKTVSKDKKEEPKQAKSSVEEFSEAKLQEITDSSKLAQNIVNNIQANTEIKLKFLAMQLGTSQKKCMDELNKLEEINYVVLEFSKPSDRNPTIRKVH